MLMAWSDFTTGMGLLAKHYGRADMPKDQLTSWYVVARKSQVSAAGWREAVQEYMRTCDLFPPSVAPLLRLARVEWQLGQALPPDVREIANEIYAAGDDRDKLRALGLKLRARGQEGLRRR